MSLRWNPWRALRERDHIRLGFDEVADDVGGGAYGHLGQRAVIVLSPSLNRRERSAQLAHELVHDERRVTSPAATEATMQREEATVRRLVALRLVPLDELTHYAADRPDPVMAWEVADHFDVPEHVAWEALRALQTRLLEEELRRTVG